MADIILTGDLDSTSVGTKGADIAIDDSSGDNVVNLGAGNDMLKYYVSANLDALSQYNGGSGIDTLMLMLDKVQYDSVMASTLLSDFNAWHSASFDFSKYDSILGFHVDIHAVNFENLVFNRIASATDDHYEVGENDVLNVDLAHNVLLNDDDSIAENKVIVAYGTKDEFGNVINNHMSEAGIALVLNPDGTISYDPRVVFDGLNTGQSADDKFYYELQVSDPNSAAIVSNSVATVIIKVNGVTDNHSPVAQPLVVSVNEDNILSSHVVATDQDINDTLTYTIPVGAGPSHGSLVMNANGTFTYTPVLNYDGADSFIYQVDDGHGGVATATVSITVDPVNDAPVAQDATLVMDASTPSTSFPGQFELDGSLAPLASDVDGDPLTFMVLTDPAHGSLFRTSTGDFVYTPAAGFSGTDSFTYKASDGLADSNVATVTITVPIYGTGGNDLIRDTAGSDIIYGLGGFDTILVSGGAGNTVYGGDDNDDIRFVGGTNNVAYGGNGNDVISIELGNGLSVTATGGAGNDKYSIDFFTNNTTIIVTDFDLVNDVINAGTFVNATASSDPDAHLIMHFATSGRVHTVELLGLTLSDSGLVHFI